MNLKWILSAVLLFSLQTNAQTGYQINVTLKPFNKGYLFLAFYYGKKQMLVDSAAINANSQAIFKGKENLKPGIYLVAFPKKDGWFEMIIDKEQRFSVVADSADLINKISFTGSPDNNLFSQYQKFVGEAGREMNALQQKYNTATSKIDSSQWLAKLVDKNKSIQVFRETFAKTNPKHLLTSIFNVMAEPQIPKSLKDSTAIYYYFKNHYWDKINLTDNRLIRTPIFEGKLNKYFDEIINQDPDTIKVAVDDILLGARANKDMFQYFLANFADKYVNPKYMGQDAVFVHLFQKYFVSGQADEWMNEKYKKFIFDRGYSMMANIIGEKGADLTMVDINGKPTNLYGVQAPFTIVCFWDPTCSHCQAEVPKLDSLYQNSWKAKGIKMYGVMTDGGLDKWKAFIKEHHLNDWIHVYQTPELKEKEAASGKPGFRQLYDVYQTPMIYVLDQEKHILAKKLSYDQLSDFLTYKLKNKEDKK
ncbi:MAG: DUF5106 domain-containing protein [Chitinophagaceae bacterium]|nr:DUF5106 domain-containing protein [Chitinophagaceae bacterium]